MSGDRRRDSTWLPLTEDLLCPKCGTRIFATQRDCFKIRPHGRYPVFHWRSFWPMGLRETDSLPPMRAFATFRAKPPRQALATRVWSSYHLFYQRRLESVHSRVTASGKPGDAAANDEHGFVHRGFSACRRYKYLPRSVSVAPASATRGPAATATKNDTRSQEEPKSVPSAVVVHLVDFHRFVEQRDDEHNR